MPLIVRQLQYQITAEGSLINPSERPFVTNKWLGLSFDLKDVRQMSKVVTTLVKDLG